MNSLRVTVLLVLVACFSLISYQKLSSPDIVATESPPSAVGSSMDGSFAARQGGSTYTLNLSVPPGIGGATPSLALSYSSGQNNGAFGVGFRVQGVSGISRCGTEIASDGIKGGVAYDENDQYCLDGKRLINVGTDEAPSYRTQLESWQRIVPVTGSCDVDPCGFRLSRGDGTLVTFGVDDLGKTQNGSAVNALGANGIRVWMQDTVLDPSGNRVTYRYSQQPTLISGNPSDQRSSGQSYLDQISYGENEHETRLVKFLYEEGRSDTPVSYLGGGSITTALLVKQIRTSLVVPADQPVMRYTLDYENAPTTGRKRLKSVTQCTPLSVCLPPIVFTWTNGGNSFDAQSLESSIANNTDAFLGDFNGDGLTDILSMDDDRTIYLANGSGFDSKDTCVPDNLKKMLFGDFNGDGITDLYGAFGEGNNGTLYLGSSQDKSCACSMTCPTITNIDDSDNLYAADFNGDGLTDLLASSPSSSQVYLADDSGFSATSQQGQGLMNGGGETWFGDFNGDGRADALFVTNDGDGILYFSEETTGGDTKEPSSGDTNLSAGVPTPDANLDGKMIWVADFNNDGLVDVMVGNIVAQGAVSAYINYGTGTTLKAGKGLTLGLSQNNYIGDFNGDGLPDILVAQDSGSLYLGDGTDFACVEPCNGMNAAVDIDSSFFGDFNGDGLTDIFTGNGQSSVFHFSGQDGQLLPSNRAADMLESITNGYGGQTHISYQPITNPNVYTASNSNDSRITALGNLYHATPLSPTFVQTYPVRPIRSGQYVVSSYSYDDNRDYGYSYNYRFYYEHGVLNLFGRGWMGFSTVTKSDPQLKAQITTTFRQDFPFNGRPSQQTTCDLPTDPTQTTCPDDNALQTVIAKWKCVDSQSQGVCNAYNQGYAKGDTEVFFVSVDQTTTNDAILGSSIITSYVHDKWGNLQTTGALADTSDPDSIPLYTCSSFMPPDKEAWIFSYPQYTKKTINDECTTDIDTWDLDSDLQLTYLDYDPNYNLSYRMRWDDQNNQWLGIYMTYTEQGLHETVTEANVATVNDLKDYKADKSTTFTATYDSANLGYLTSLTTPDPGNGAGPLTLGFAYDARFGTLVSRQDPNGNIINHCVDDFGLSVATQGPAQGKATSVNCIDDKTYPYVDTAFINNKNVVTTQTLTYGQSGSVASVVQSGRSSWDDGAGWTSLTRIFDGFGRTVATNYINDQNTLMTRQTVYQDPSLVQKQSIPGKSADDFLVYYYDAVGRVTSTTQPTWNLAGTKSTSTNGYNTVQAIP